MNRWLGMAVVAAGLTFGACGSSEKKQNPTPAGPTFVAAPDNEAIVGSWSDGASTVTFNGNGSYTWELARPCGSPPCPTTSTSGTWTVRSGKIYLDPQDGGDEVIEFAFANQQKSVTLSSNKQNASWNLNKR